MIKTDKKGIKRSILSIICALTIFTSIANISTVAIAAPALEAAPAPEAVVIPAPTVTDVEMKGSTIAVTLDYYSCVGTCVQVDLYTKKGKLVESQTRYFANAYFYDVPEDKIYYAVAKNVAADGNVSEYSNAKYVIAQPTISKKSKVNKNSINLKWKKIKGAKEYVVYAKKTTSSKWKKVKTTKKNNWTMSKFNGKSFNCTNTHFDIKVVAKAKVDGQKLKSDDSKSVYTYTYYK